MMESNNIKQSNHKKGTARLKFALISIWQGFLGIVSPFVIGIIFMLITGHGKGYDYYLGSEVVASIIIGMLFSLIWLFVSLPSFMWILFRYFEYKKKYILLPYLLYLLMALISILIMGIPNFLSFFGL